MQIEEKIKQKIAPRFSPNHSETKVNESDGNSLTNLDVAVKIVTAKITQGIDSLHQISDSEDDSNGRFMVVGLTATGCVAHAYPNLKKSIELCLEYNIVLYETLKIKPPTSFYRELARLAGLEEVDDYEIF